MSDQLPAQDSTMIRWSILYDGLSQPPIDVDLLLIDLRAYFETEVIADDCYEYEIRCKRDVLDRLERQGKVFRHKDVLLADIRNKQTVYGDGKTVRFSAATGIAFEGVICQRQVLLQCRSRNEPETEAVAETIRHTIESCVNHAVTIKKYAK